MELQKMSPSAYMLRKYWEKEDRKLFRKFNRDCETIRIINALAELLIELERGSNPIESNYENSYAV